MTSKSTKYKTHKPFYLRFHTGMRGFSSKRLALKADVIRPENVLFAGRSVFQPGHFPGCVGVKHLRTCSVLFASKSGEKNYK